MAACGVIAAHRGLVWSGLAWSRHVLIKIESFWTKGKTGTLQGRSGGGLPDSATVAALIYGEESPCRGWKTQSLSRCNCHQRVLRQPEKWLTEIGSRPDLTLARWAEVSRKGLVDATTVDRGDGEPPAF